MNTKNYLWSEKETLGEIDFNSDYEEVRKKNTWHKLFESTKWILLNPAEEIINFNYKYLENPSKQFKNRTNLQFKKIHDLGCGGGRHMYYFAELGYEVTGSDISTNAIDFTKLELQRRGLKADLVLTPMTELPFEDNYFDITISRATINHSTLNDIKKVIHEVARTTKKGGLFFVTFSSERASDWKKGLEVVEDLTYIPQEGPEKGLVHTFVNATNAAALLEPFFLIEEIYLAEHPPLIIAENSTNPNEYFGSEYVIVGIRR